MNSPLTDDGADPLRPDLRRNIELKARLVSLDGATDLARELATERLGIQHQVDTYFHCSGGRLKLREINASEAQLIWYSRPDQAEARKSEYYLLDVADVGQTKELLTAALGVRRVVVKRREIFMVDNVRIHLDRVDGLGCFLEFEAVMASTDDLARGHEQLRWLSERFGIAPRDVLSGSYGDMG